MFNRILAILLCLAIPVNVSAGPLKESIDRVARELAVSQEAQAAGGRTRFWTNIALLAGGGTLAILGSTEAFDDDGPDDVDELDDDETELDGEDDSDWGNKAMLGGGIAAAALGGYRLWKGRGQSSASRITVQPGRFMVRLRF